MEAAFFDILINTICCWWCKLVYSSLDNYSDNQKMLDLSLLESSNLIRFRRKIQLVHPHFTNIINTFTNTFPNNLNDLLPNLSDDEEVVFEHSHYSLTELGESFCNIVFN